MRLTGHSCQGKGKFRANRGFERRFRRSDSRVVPRAADVCGQIRMARGTRHGHRARHVRNLAAMRLRWSGRRRSGGALRGGAGCGWLRPVRRCPVAAVHHRARAARRRRAPRLPRHRRCPTSRSRRQCPAPGVMQGCLESTSGLLMQPDSKSALVAERTTGAVKEVSVSAEPKVKTVIPVDPAGDGGLMDIVLSPTYSQDRLMYAYISTPTDNRVIRVADGDIPKDILTGIPKGANGNHRRAALHQPDDAGRADRRRGQPGDGQRPGIAGRQGHPPRAADHAQPGTADHGAERYRRRRRPVHRPGRRLAVCPRPRSHRRPAAANHQGLEGFHGVDVAGPTRGGRLRGPGRHRAGQPGQHQADGGRPPGAGHRRGHRSTRRRPPGHRTGTRGRCGCRRTATCGARRSTKPTATP